MRISALSFAIALAALAMPVTTAVADDVVKVGALKLENVWSRATPTGAKVGAGYMKITNTGTEADTLVSATHPNAGRVEIHTMTMEGGVMKMRKLEEGLEIPAGATVELKPGGYHVMFLQLGKGMSEGETINASLTFKTAGTVDVSYAVKGMAAGMSHGGHKSMDHGKSDHGHAGHGKTN